MTKIIWSVEKVSQQWEVVIEYICSWIEFNCEWYSARDSLMVKVWITNRKLYIIIMKYLFLNKLINMNSRQNARLEVVWMIFRKHDIYCYYPGLVHYDSCWYTTDIRSSVFRFLFLFLLKTVKLLLLCRLCKRHFMILKLVLRISAHDWQTIS